MRRWALAGVLTATLTCSAGQAADSDVYQLPKPAKKTNWWWPFGGSQKKEPTGEVDPKPAEPKKAVEPKKSAVSPRQSSPIDDPEYKTYLRRERACNKLIALADETNDTELRIQAEDMIRRAWEVYLQRTGRARGSELSEAEERALTQRLLDEAKRDREVRGSPYHVEPAASDMAGRPVRSVNGYPPPIEKEE